jgi:hypothetical protein
MSGTNNPDNKLRNLHHALQLNDEAQPELRVGARITNPDPIPVTLGSETITIEGDVIVSSSVEVNNTEADAVHTHITQVGTSGVLNVPYLPVAGTVTANQGTSPWVVTGTVTNIVNPTATDAFGRARVSNPFTLFDSSFRYSDNPAKWNQAVTGSGSVTHLPNESTMSLGVTTANGDSVIRETKRVFNYQPGKSLLIMNTFVMATPKANLRQRVGFFGAQNGIYFECVTDGAGVTSLNLVIRKYTGGFVDDTSEKVAQSGWNGDRLTGAGGANNPSGYNLDVTKSQIFWMDVEWLGVGTVRCGFVINGEFIVCHKFHHANILSAVYMTTATLPIRYEITNTNTTSGASTLKQICSTVISEGGYAATSRSRSASNALVGTECSQTVFTPLISIRLKSDRLDGVVLPARLDVFGRQTNPYKWAVIVGGTLTKSTPGALSWVDVGSDSSVEYNLNATDISGGTIIDQGIFVGNTIGGPVSATPVGQTQDVQLGRLLDGTAEILTVAAIATNNKDTAVCSLVWEEF